jgi:hypothetical protein
MINSAVKATPFPETRTTRGLAHDLAQNGKAASDADVDAPMSLYFFRHGHHRCLRTSFVDHTPHTTALATGT